MTTLTAPAEASSGPVGAPPARRAPIKWRQALLMALAVYPFITVYILVIFPFTAGWAIWQRTAILVPLMVLTIVYCIAPLMQKHLGWFITGQPVPARK